MRLVCLQPGYIPWAGFFDQMDRSEVFVIYDNVAFDKGGWRARNRIKTPQGAQWLSVPVVVSGFPLIKDVKIDNHDNWAIKHLKSIKQNYSRAPYFKDYIGIFEDIYSKPWEYLIDLDMAFIFKIRECLGNGTTIEFASNLKIEGERTQRLVDMCLKLGATEFLEGHAGKGYLQGEGEQLFKENGINLVYQDYNHPIYPQLYGEFRSHLSVVDLLFNCGKESLDIIRKGR